MKLPSAKTKVEAFTLVELLVVIFIVVILAAILLPSSHVGQKAYSAMCMSNQKQIALGFIMWKSDYNEQFPWQISSTNYGAMEAANRGYAAANFQVSSNYIRWPQVLVCPTDKARNTATNVAQLRNQNISYFVALGSNTNVANNILTGDRHLEANGKPAEPGLFVYSTNLTMNWTHELHDNVKNSTFGCFSFADGHAERIMDKGLNSIFQREGLATNRLCIP